MNKRKNGFTLIELLIVIAIIGILAAIAIPNLLNAVQRAKQKRSVADIRALATAIEAYHVDNGVFPTAASGSCAGVYTTAGIALASGSFTILSPTYVSQPPMRDGWGRFLIYNVDNGLSKYNIRSHGRDGTVGTEVCSTTTNFNDDIIYSNGTFIQWPDGAQN